MRRAYRLHRLKFRTFKYLLRNHSLEHLISTIASHYQTFAETINLSLSGRGVEVDYESIPWSTTSLEESWQRTLIDWLRQRKSKNQGLLNVLLFRVNSPRLSYEHRQDGLLFAGIQDGKLSAETIRDLSCFVSSLDTHQVENLTAANGGETNGKRSVSLPGLTESWDSVVQTSSNLFSALSFGTVPARRSPLSISPERSVEDTKRDKAKYNGGKWIVGGETDSEKVWIEITSQKSVPISLGNQRPGFMRELSGQQTPDEDGLTETEVSVYKV